ncbi:MAG TPA: hypothetical protein EYP92_03820 [Candidatus Thioglobus sp.]|nr:hypothetical protein [Candidatus Thioglobus sp.]
MISRRFFLKGTVATAAGLILPSWVVHAERYIEGEGLPFLEPLKSHQNTLFAVDWNGEGVYELSLGDPFAKPDLHITWEEYIERYTYVETLQDYFEGEDPIDIPGPDELVGERQVYEAFEYWKKPSRQAFRYLYDLDLGPELDGDNGVGEISFYDGVSPGNDDQFVHVPDYLSISLLQKRLNEIDGTVAVEVLGPDELNGREPFFL